METFEPKMFLPRQDSDDDLSTDIDTPERDTESGCDYYSGFSTSDCFISDFVMLDCISSVLPNQESWCCSNQVLVSPKKKGKKRKAHSASRSSNSCSSFLDPYVTKKLPNPKLTSSTFLLSTDQLRVKKVEDSEYDYYTLPAINELPNNLLESPRKEKPSLGHDLIQDKSLFDEDSILNCSFDEYLSEYERQNEFTSSCEAEPVHLADVWDALVSVSPSAACTLECLVPCAESVHHSDDVDIEFYEEIVPSSSSDDSDVPASPSHSIVIQPIEKGCRRQNEVVPSIKCVSVELFAPFEYLSDHDYSATKYHTVSNPSSSSAKLAITTIARVVTPCLDQKSHVNSSVLDTKNAKNVARKRNAPSDDNESSNRSIVVPKKKNTKASSSAVKPVEPSVLVDQKLERCDTTKGDKKKSVLDFEFLPALEFPIKKQRTKSTAGVSNKRSESVKVVPESSSMVTNSKSFVEKMDVSVLRTEPSTKTTLGETISDCIFSSPKPAATWNTRNVAPLSLELASTASNMVDASPKSDSKSVAASSKSVPAVVANPKPHSSHSAPSPKSASVASITVGEVTDTSLLLVVTQTEKLESNVSVSISLPENSKPTKKISLEEYKMRKKENTVVVDPAKFTSLDTDQIPSQSPLFTFSAKIEKSVSTSPTPSETTVAFGRPFVDVTECPTVPDSGKNFEKSKAEDRRPLVVSPKHSSSTLPNLRLAPIKKLDQGAHQNYDRHLRDRNDNLSPRRKDCERKFEASVIEPANSDRQDASSNSTSTSTTFSPAESSDRLSSSGVSSYHNSSVSSLCGSPFTIHDDKSNESVTKSCAPGVSSCAAKKSPFALNLDLLRGKHSKKKRRQQKHTSRERSSSPPAAARRHLDRDSFYKSNFISSDDHPPKHKRIRYYSSSSASTDCSSRSTSAASSYSTEYEYDYNYNYEYKPAEGTMSPRAYGEYVRNREYPAMPMPSAAAGYYYDEMQKVYYSSPAEWPMAYSYAPSYQPAVDVPYYHVTPPPPPPPPPYETSRIREDERYDMECAEQRRILYVNKVEKRLTTSQFEKRFEKFGNVEKVQLICRQDGSRYGFITYSRMEQVHNAMIHGNDDMTLPPYEYGYGGRNHFCRNRYADLDYMGVFSSTNPPTDSFDSKLKAFQSDLRRIKSTHPYNV